MRTDVTSVREIPEMHTMGHTCANLNGELLFVWGGTNDRVAYLAIKNSSIWIYETLTGYWRHRTCSGDCPPYLSSCASCLIGQKMYIFGGHSTVQDNWLNCLYCLDLETFIWADLGAQARAQPTKPIRSDKNVAWSFNRRLYVFGGYGWSQVEHFLELLDCQKDLQLVPDHRWPKFGWNNQLVEYNPADKTWRWPHYTGKCPSARAAHSGALMGDNYFVFGGRDSHERLNDLHTLNMQTLDWQHVAIIAHDSSSPQRALRQPIGHLLESNQSNDIQPVSRDQPERLDEGNAEQQSGDDMEANHHRQIVEEMHEVGVDEEEDDAGFEGWNLPAMTASTSSSAAAAPSSSSSSSTASQSNISQLHTAAESAKMIVDDLDLVEEDDYEYPHPSHLLERWSLSSNNDGDGTIGGCSEHHDEHELNQAHTSQHQAQLGHNELFVGNMTAPTQSVLIHEHSAQEQRDNHMPDIDQHQRQQLARAESETIGSTAPLPLPAPSADINQDHHHQQQQQPQGVAELANNVELGPAERVPSIPPGRSFCSLTPISSDEMLLFGGVNSQDDNLDDCWLFNVSQSQWTQIDHVKHNRKLIRPRLWHTGSRTKQNEVVIIGGSCSDQIDEYCSEVLLISFEPRSLKRLALDTVSRAVRMKTIQQTRGIPSTLIKLIKLRKQAMALTTYRSPEATNSIVQSR